MAEVWGRVEVAGGVEMEEEEVWGRVGQVGVGAGEFLYSVRGRVELGGEGVE